jgi:small subunit ribosomal protein S6
VALSSELSERLVAAPSGATATSGRSRPGLPDPRARRPSCPLRGHGLSQRDSRPKEGGVIVPTYEATYIIDTNVNEADLGTVVEKYQTQVANTGEILSLDNKGRHRMAYEIDGKREGTYVIMRFKAEPAVAAELDRTMKIDDNIIRALIIRLN